MGAISKKTSRINGVITIPGDKSISHRSLILASQCVGRTKITGLLESEDVLHTAEALKNLGVPIKKTNKTWVVDGVGVGGLRDAKKKLYLGNSGTGVRLLMGLVSSYPFTSEFTGDESLSRRPMGRVIDPLKLTSAVFEAKNNMLPLKVTGNHNMIPIKYTVPVASAQVKSAILLAALNIPGRTTVIEKSATRNHTELMMKYLGVDLKVKGNEISITGQPELKARDIKVPSDPSSAAFFVIAALIVPGSKITVKNVNINKLRVGLYQTLKEMGANIKYKNKRKEAGEDIADIEVSYSKLKGVSIPAERAPSMIDEYPILAVAAAFAKGKTKMNGLEELRVKESDRLAAIENGLKENGVKFKSGEDWLEIEGSETVQGGGSVKTHMDHRIAMSFLVMGAATEKPVTVDDTSMIATSFPNFLQLFKKVGGKIKPNGKK